MDTKHCECGCGAVIPTRKSNGRPQRFAPYHHGRKSPVEYVVDDATGCWVWQRSTDSRGYGKFKREGRIYAAHRAYYAEHVGPVPAGLEIDHLCHNPACVNPEHLEPVTHAENLRRRRWARRPGAVVA